MSARSLLGAVVCIALSLVPLVVVLVVSDGMIQGITGRLIGLASYHVQVVPDAALGVADDLESLEAIAEIITGVEGVSGAYVERQSIALASGGSTISSDGERSGSALRVGASVRAVAPAIFTGSPAFSGLFAVQEGTTDLRDGVGGTRKALLGTKIAQDLGVHAGDTIRLIILRKVPSGAVIPGIASFTVAAVISAGYQELDARWVFISDAAGFALLSGESSRTIIGVEVADPFAPTFPDTLRKINGLIPAGFAAYSWERMNEAQFENFESTKTMLLFVMILIVLVAAVNISSALVILVIERRREIAILKSLGATAGGITAAFLLTGLFAGLAGVVFGLPLGLAAAVNVNEIITFIEKVVNKFSFFLYTMRDVGGGEFFDVHLLDPAYYLDSIPVVIGFRELFIIVAGTLVLSVMVSAVPAFKAGSERPIHTLRRV